MMMNDDANESNNKYRTNNKKATISKSFEYNTKIIGSTPGNTNRLSVEIVAPLKYLINVWRSLNLSLITCKIELDLTWSKNCVKMVEIIQWMQHKQLEQRLKQIALNFISQYLLCQ